MRSDVGYRIREIFPWVWRWHEIHFSLDLIFVARSKISSAPKISRTETGCYLPCLSYGTIYSNIRLLSYSIDVFYLKIFLLQHHQLSIRRRFHLYMTESTQALIHALRLCIYFLCSYCNSNGEIETILFNYILYYTHRNQSSDPGELLT